MRSFKLTPQRNGDVVVNGYSEDGKHVGAVARVSGIAAGKPVVQFTKPLSLAGLAEILECLDAELRPQAAEAATDVKAPRASKASPVTTKKGD